MYSPEKPHIKDAIIECYKITKQKQLDFGDIYFLLNNKPLKRFPTKDKKKLYQNWEKSFKTQFKWINPLKLYEFKTSYLAKMLKELIEDNILERTNGHYELTDFGYIIAIRTQEKNRMNYYLPHNIEHLDNLTFYGFFPHTQGYLKYFENEILDLKNQMINIRKKFDKIEKSLTKLNVDQVKFLFSAIMYNIENDDFKEKEIKLAKFFLKNILTNPNYKDYKWYEIKGKPILKVANYKLDKQLSQYLKNILATIVGYYEKKPIVFIPKLTEKGTLKFYKTMENLIKNFC
jgi:hypothetical protein